ncbi:LamG-like jellyroll fold domain-containing protein [Olleya sp. R77988]|uniref:LamG-like jellyroll fold domain-containing protein n=1 Tax=Olleya sp. R77988 TaxID=3093875 RepID=UPI0037CC938A
MNLLLSRNAHLCFGYNSFSVISKYILIIVLSLTFTVNAQTNAPSIQNGVSFQWSDNQTDKQDSATIETITVDGTLYYNFGVPSGYELTQLGPGGHDKNSIRFDGVLVENSSANTTWNTSALDAFQSLNLNHYFVSNGNGDNICDDYEDEETTDAQRQTLTYGSGIKSNSSGLIAITERNANNCYHIEFFGIPFGGTVEQSLGETFVNQGNSTEFGFGGTGGANNLGTPGAVNPPTTNSDYWLSDRVVNTGGTIGIALFYLDDIAPFGSTITKVQLTAATNDNGDGKLFILTFPDYDEDSLSNIDDLDDDNDGILDTDESNGINPSGDHDVDGVLNYQDADFCTLNSSGVCVNLDFDSDGIPNHLDLDSDNDGISDVLESGGTDVNFDGIADGTVGTTATTFGIPSSAGTGNIPTNTDNTSNYDFLDLDSDDDGIPDNIEAQTTNNYIAPSGNGLAFTDLDSNGIDDNYNLGFTTLVDTDGDGILDYLDLDSDNDGKQDIEENGMANTITTFTDSDTDGLDNLFEGLNVNDSSDVNDEIDNPLDLTILPDTDSDLSIGGDLDYRDLFDVNPPNDATLDFDGIDDYVVGAETFSNINQTNTDGATLMAWIKSDSDASDVSQKFVLGEKNAIEITLTGENIYAKIHYVKSDNTTATKSVYRSTTGIIRNIWRHVTVSVSFTENKAYLLLDGDFVFSTNLFDAVAFRSSITAEEDKLRMGNDQSFSASKFFKGSIDEVRVFNKFIPEEEVKRIVYQEIENNSGQVQGAKIKNQLDSANWSDLQVYYPLNNVTTGTIKDESLNSNDAEMFNITTIQEQSAPMPFVTKQSGNWHDKNTWLHGDIWYVPADEVVQAATYGSDEVVTWGIYHIKHSVNLTTSLSKPNYPRYHKGLLAQGVIVDEKDDANNDVVFTIGSSSEDLQLNVSKYLEINGTIDLKNDSQLIQGLESDLVTSDKGQIQRRQEGQSSVYRYNYWSSPVGEKATTALFNNNTISNNLNNSSFTLNMLKDASGNDVQFTDAYDEDGKLSTYWFYSYQNGITYYDWNGLNTNTPITTGLGYTQKGGGSLSSYTFEGKPNNGTVLLSAADTGGAGSVGGVSRTESLVGNPYASAIDAHQFIDDNSGVIGGAIYLWEQWAGNSHNLNAYEGGYATLNKLGKVRAYQFIGMDGGNTGYQGGQKTPKQYIPVGQGFMVEVTGTGDIEFNNGQRIFKTETAGQSIFFKNSNQEDSESISQTDSLGIQKIKLEFKTNSDLGRELVLGFSDTTTDEFDYGYDALAKEVFANDLTMTLNSKPMVIQAFDHINVSKVIDLNFKADGVATYSIKAIELLNIADDQVVYLLDNQTGVYHDLKSGLPYNFTSQSGEFNSRFDIVFQNSNILSNEDFELETENTLIYFNNTQDQLFVKGLQQDVKAVTLYNSLGQKVFNSFSVTNNQLENGLQISNLSSGLYIVSVKTDNNQTIDKKIIIK